MSKHSLAMDYACANLAPDIVKRLAGAPETFVDWLNRHRPDTTGYSAIILEPFDQVSKRIGIPRFMTEGGKKAAEDDVFIAYVQQNRARRHNLSVSDAAEARLAA